MTTRSIARARTERGGVAAGSNSSSSTKPWQIAAVCASLVILVLALFGKTVAYDFVNYDDDQNVSKNPVVAHGLSIPGIRWAFTHTDVGHWDPVTILSHMVDCQVFGLWPGGHHLTNLLFYAATVALLFVLLQQMTGAFWRAAFVAAIWAVHPLRVESVAWISERKDMLSGFFFMLTLLAYVHYARTPRGKESTLRYLSVAVLFTLGLMSKSMLMTLPFVLMLLDFWPLQRWRPGRAGEGGSTAPKLFAEKIPLLLISFAFAIAAIVAARPQIASLQYAPLTQRLGDAMVTTAIYLRQMIWPADLAVRYMRPPGGVPPWELILSAAVLLAVTGAAIWWRKEQPWLITGWLWYLGMLVPVAGFFQSQNFPQDDRYTYLPQIGLCIAATWIAAEWAGENRACQVAAIAAIIALACGAFRQTSFWKNSETLWTHALACAPDPAGYNSLGLALMDKGDLGEAMTNFKAAIRSNPDFADAYYNLGVASQQQGQFDDAIAQYRAALRLNPNSADAWYNLGVALARTRHPADAVAAYQKALAADSTHAKANNDFGVALMSAGRLDEAIAHYRRAIETDPAYAEAHYNLGVALQQKGDLDGAQAAFEEALAIQPRNALALNNLGTLLESKGDLAGAEAEFQKALAIDPSFVVAINNLGGLLQRKGDVAGAIAAYRKTLGIDPHNADACYNLGVAFKQQGDLAQAIEAFNKAVTLQPEFMEAHANLADLLATAADARLRDGAQAVAHASEANRLSGASNPIVLRILASAYAEEGRFGDAIESLKKAIAAAQSQANGELADDMQRDLNLYQAGKPLRRN